MSARLIIALLAMAVTMAVGHAAAAGEAGEARAVGDSPEERFARAAEAMAAGAHADAVAGFLRLAEDAPSHALAGDALFSAARILEERLAEPARALDVYRRLVAEYPHSRTALAASRRADALARDLGPDAGNSEAVARFTEIVQGFSERGEYASIAMAEALVADHPGWPGAPRALLWLAQVHRRGGRHAQAQARYLEVAQTAASPDDVFDGYRGAGDMASRMRRFDEAEAFYRRMPVRDDPGRRRSFEDALADLERDRVRARIYHACFAVAGGMFLLLLLLLRLAAGNGRRAVRALWPPPIEVMFMAPIAALLTGVAYTGHELIGPAVLLVCTAGLIVTWSSNAGLNAGLMHGARAGKLRATVHATVAVVAMAAMIYIAVHRHGLLDQIVETVRFGPDA